MPDAANQAAPAHNQERQRLESLQVSSYRIPTDRPESDGTLAWDATTLVLVQARAGGKVGLGYTYADRATALFIQEHFESLLVGQNVFDLPAAFERMRRACRNLGQQGVGAMALSATDCALWDLKARLLGVPLIALLGRCRQQVEVYGSGGFTSYSEDDLREQFQRWQDLGIRLFKMKVGRDPEQDPIRVQTARDLLGGDAALFVDANGAYRRKQALDFAHVFAECGVSWFEEPVSSDDLDGLRLLRDQSPPGLDISAGEYGYDLGYFRRMLAEQAVDILQADVTRCGGITGFLQVAALCEAFQIPLSCHCAPTLHLPLAAALPSVIHQEYFHDHALIEQRLLEGAITPHHGMLTPDDQRPGFGFEFKFQDGEAYAC